MGGDGRGTIMPFEEVGVKPVSEGGQIMANDCCVNRCGKFTTVEPVKMDIMTGISSRQEEGSLKVPD